MIQPSKAMIEAGAQALVDWEGMATPQNNGQVIKARLKAQRIWLTMEAQRHLDEADREDNLSEC